MASKFSFAQPAGMSDKDARNIERSIRLDKRKAKGKAFKNPCGKFKARKSKNKLAHENLYYDTAMVMKNHKISEANNLSKRIMESGSYRNAPLW